MFLYSYFLLNTFSQAYGPEDLGWPVAAYEAFASAFKTTQPRPQSLRREEDPCEQQVTCLQKY